MRRRNRGSGRFRWIAASLAVMAASPAAAEFLPKPDEIASVDERPVFTDTLLKLLYAPMDGGAASLRAFDDALARLPKPTPFRGLVQFGRAGALIAGDKEAEAREAIDESIRLLPDHSGPLLTATDLYAYSDQPGRAADYLMRASRIDPQIVARESEYEVDNLMNRLAFVEDHRRIRVLSERLLEIGWKAETLDAQSSLVARAIEARMTAGETQGAAALVPRLIAPGHTQALLAQNRYRALWPDLERWAGPKLETQWRTYLSENRERWEASGSSANARAYLSALGLAGHDDTIIRTFLPLFSKQIDASRDQDLIYIVSPLGNALARKGRWNDIDAMYDQALNVWPMGQHANALNLTANRARLLFYRDRPLDGLREIDATIADAARYETEVNGAAIAGMHQLRACILHALGRDAEAALSHEVVGAQRSPLAQVGPLLCLGRHDAARDVMIAALTDEEARDDVLAWVQPSRQPPMASAYGLADHARYQALRSDPRLLAAIAEHGRVLPFGIGDGAPPEEPAAGKARP